MGSVGQCPFQYDGRDGVSQRHHYSHERRGSIEVFDRARLGMQSRDGRQHSQTLSPARPGWIETPQAAGTNLGGNALVSASVARSGDHAAANVGLWVQCLVGGSSERAPEKANEDF